jgi:hypothetical protein
VLTIMEVIVVCSIQVTRVAINHWHACHRGAGIPSQHANKAWTAAVHSFRKFLSHVFCGGSKIAKNQKNQKISGTISSSPTRSLFSPWTYMVYRTISPDLKQRALYLLLEEGWEIGQIPTALGVHSKSIKIQKVPA